MFTVDSRDVKICENRATRGVTMLRFHTVIVAKMSNDHGIFKMCSSVEKMLF